MTKFFQKLVDNGPQYIVVCSNTVRDFKCRNRSGCGGVGNNATYSYDRDRGTGTDCGGYKFENCGCFI